MRWAKAKLRRSETKTGQLGLLAPEAMDSDYFTSLVDRYRGKARDAVEATLVVGRDVAYETLVDVALSWPMTAEADLKRWLADLAGRRIISYGGMGPRERVPKLDRGHVVRRGR